MILIAVGSSRGYLGYDGCYDSGTCRLSYPMSFYFSFKSDHLSELQEIVI